MKNRTINSLVVVIVAAFNFACSPIYYSPTTHNVPLFKEKGEVKVVPTFSDQRVGLDLAFSPDEHIGVILGTNLTTISLDSLGNGGNGGSFETGVGYFHHFSDFWTFETYVLGGIARMDILLPRTTAQYPETIGRLQANISRIGVQPNLGFSTKFLDVAISSKISSISYHNIGGSLFLRDENQVQYLNLRKNHFLIEPALTIRGGYKFIKIHFQLQRSFNLTYQDFEQLKNLAVFGLTYSFGRKHY